MDRFRRNSKSSLKSVKSVESPTTSSATSQLPTPNLEPQPEEDLFKQIQNHLKEEENVSGAEKLRNMLNQEAKFGSDVDLADEAYKTPRKAGDKNSKIPKPEPPSDGKTTGPEEDKPEPVESTIEGKPEVEDGQFKDGRPLAAGHDDNGGDAAGKKEDDIDDHIPMLVNLVIGCTAFTIAVILVTYYILKDLVPVIVSNFSQQWKRFTASLIDSPAFVNNLCEEVFEPIMPTTLPEMFKNPFSKPAAIKTTEPEK